MNLDIAERIITTLTEHPDCTSEQLTHHVNANPTTTRTTRHHLQHLGLITSHPDPHDRRTTRWQLAHTPQHPAASPLALALPARVLPAACPRQVRDQP